MKQIKVMMSATMSEPQKYVRDLLCQDLASVMAKDDVVEYHHERAADGRVIHTASVWVAKRHPDRPYYQNPLTLSDFLVLGKPLSKPPTNGIEFNNTDEDFYVDSVVNGLPVWKKKGVEEQDDTAEIERLTLALEAVRHYLESGKVMQAIVEIDTALVGGDKT